MQELIKAVIKVMDDCKGVEKNLKVGSNNSSYQGVSAKDVFLKVSQSMVEHGLAMFPIDIEETTEFQQYIDSYGKQKNRFFTRVKVKYELTHESGESKVIVGLGHGADSLDKASGKALTYAQKTTLLYQFLIATGHVDDTDNTHSDELSNETQSHNGFRDNRIDPFSSGDTLINQVVKMIDSIHKNTDQLGDSPTFEDFKNAPIEAMGEEFGKYKNIERLHNYYIWVQKKLKDTDSIWTLERLEKLRAKCKEDQAFTDDISAIINKKSLEISQ